MYYKLYQIVHYIHTTLDQNCAWFIRCGQRAKGTVCMEFIVIGQLDFLIDRPAKLDEQAMLHRLLHGNSNIHGRYVAAVVLTT